MSEELITGQPETTIEQAAEAVAPAESSPAQEPQEPKRDNVQRRIDRLTREKYQIQAERDLLRQQLQQNQRPAPQPESPKEPTINDFQDFDAYLTAKAKWIAEQTTQEQVGRVLAYQRQQDVLRRGQEEDAKILSNWNKSVQGAKKDMPDFEEVVGAADVDVSPQVARLIMSSDPAVLYHLARNPDEAQRLNTMGADAAARAIGRIEARMDAEAKARQSNAPRGLDPLKGSGAATAEPSVNDDMATWIKKRNKQLGR